MGDPLSVTGPAVGIVSLGLTVCQSLISYYGPWSAYDEEISELARKAEGLKTTLQTVQGTLEKFESTEMIQTKEVQTRIMPCIEALQRLEKEIEKCKKSQSPSNFRDKLQAIRKRVLYPFKRETLLWLRNTVEGLQANLNTTFQVLQL
jgi:hypothetical protein